MHFCYDKTEKGIIIQQVCWVYAAGRVLWLTGDGEGHWRGHQLHFPSMLSAAGELGVIVFLLGRVL